jgi:hypothetical protein
MSMVSSGISTLSASFLAATLSIQFCIAALAASGDVRINEIAAVNLLGLKDEDGDRSDWIELRNESQTAVNLTGWALTDNPDQEDKWIFPALALPPNGYLFVFASGKDRDGSDGGVLHTNFELRGDGEFVGLFDNSNPRRALSTLDPSYPRQREGYTYGYSEGLGEYAFLSPETPGTSNVLAQTFLPPLEPVVATPTRGFYEGPIEVSLAHESSEATIYYTTDGNTPSPATGTLYTGPFGVDRTLPVRAVASLPGRLPSQTITHTFLIGQSQTVRSMPVLSVVTDRRHLYGREGIQGIRGGTYAGEPWEPVNPGDYHNPSQRGRNWERPASFEFLDSSDGSSVQEDAGLRVQGSDFTRRRYRANSKFSYRLYFRNGYGVDELDYPIFPESAYTRHKKIVVRAGHNDDTNPFFKDELARRLFRDMNQVSALGSFVHLFVNGELKGYYNPTERLDHDFFALAHNGGDEWDTIRQGGSTADGDRIAWNELMDATGKDLTDPESYLKVTRRLDIVNFVDYLLFNIYGATWDWPNNNWTAARERRPGARFRFYVWDAEGAFGASSNDYAFNTIREDLEGRTDEISRLYQALAVNEDFRRLFSSRVATHFGGGGALTDSNVMNRMEEMRRVLSAAIVFNSGPTRLVTWTEHRAYRMLAHMQEAGLLVPVEALRKVDPPFRAPLLPVPFGPPAGPNLNGDDRIDHDDLIEFLSQGKRGRP